jgi:Holliday junction resolvase RusA-like endonuclease
MRVLGIDPGDMINRVEFVVHGSPAPQGSKRHVGGGRMIESSKAVRPWREAVKWAATEARGLTGQATFDGPLIVSMVFTMRKPTGAPKRRRTWPDRTPDLSKLIRATEDALTDAGLIADDARIVEYARAAKVYPGEDGESLDTPGVRIVIERVQP